jgi:hypothetical protein
MSLIHNERTKLTATWLNTLATALLAAGTFAPLAALFYGFAASQVGSAYFAGLAILCFIAAVGLHMLARAVLGRLRE